MRGGKVSLSVHWMVWARVNPRLCAVQCACACASISVSSIETRRTERSEKWVLARERRPGHLDDEKGCRSSVRLWSASYLPPTLPSCHGIRSETWTFMDYALPTTHEAIALSVVPAFEIHENARPFFPPLPCHIPDGHSSGGDHTWCWQAQAGRTVCLCRRQYPTFDRVHASSR